MKGRTSLEHHLQMIDRERCALASAGRRRAVGQLGAAAGEMLALGDEVAAHLSGGLHQNDAYSMCATITSSSW